MPERVLPIGSGLASGALTEPTADNPSIRLGERDTGDVVQVAGWDSFEEHALPVVRALGFPDLGDYRTARTAGAARLFRQSRDRVLMVGIDAAMVPGGIATTENVAVLDLSHSRTCLTLEGPAVENVLARLAPIDFRLAHCPVGTFVQTGVHHVGVLIHRRSETAFDVLCPVTWARSVWQLIVDTAKPFGCAAGPFG